MDEKESYKVSDRFGSVRKKETGAQAVVAGSSIVVTKMALEQ